MPPPTFCIDARRPWTQQIATSSATTSDGGEQVGEHELVSDMLLAVAAAPSYVFVGMFL